MAFVNQLSFTANSPLQAVGNVVVSASTTSGVAMAFGSSLFLDRLYIPGPMNLSEVDLALSMAMATAASSTGSYGVVARTLVVYTFGNSTSLGSLYSTSQSITFVGTSTTTGGLTNRSNLVAGWTQAGGVIAPMTFASSALAPGDYVFGNLISFSGSANATISLFGQVANPVASVQNVTTQATAAMTVGTGTIASTAASLAAANSTGLSAFGSSNMWMHGTATTWTVSATAGTTVSANAAMTYSASTLAGSYIANSSSTAVVTSVSMNSSAVTGGRGWRVIWQLLRLQPHFLLSTTLDRLLQLVEFPGPL